MMADGFNGALVQAQKALRYLAENDRPSGGEQFPNAACCYQIADELEITRKALTPPPPHEAVTDWVRRAMRFIDLCDADCGGYGDLHEDAERLTIDGYSLFGIDIESDGATTCLADLEGRPLSLSKARG